MTTNRQRTSNGLVMLLILALLWVPVSIYHQDNWINPETYRSIDYDEAMIWLNSNYVKEVYIFKDEKFVLLKRSDATSVVAYFEDYSYAVFSVTGSIDNWMNIRCVLDANQNSSFVANTLKFITNALLVCTLIYCVKPDENTDK